MRQAGGRYKDATLSGFQRYGSAENSDLQNRVCQALSKFAVEIAANVETGRNLILFGPVGTGKDHLMFAMARAACRYVPTVKVSWISGMDLFSAVRDNIDSVRSERSQLNEWLEPDVLCLSDPIPPDGSLTDFQKAFLLRLVDARYRNNKAIWVTVNVRDGDEAAERLTPQVHDRLRDGAMACFCNWGSYRKRRTEVIA